MSRVSFSGRELNTQLIILGSESQEARQSYAVSRDSESVPLSLKYSFTSSIDLIYIQLRIIKCASCSLVAAKLKPAFATVFEKITEKFEKCILHWGFGFIFIEASF